MYNIIKQYVFIYFQTYIYLVGNMQLVTESITTFTVLISGRGEPLGYYVPNENVSEVFYINDT